MFYPVERTYRNESLEFHRCESRQTQETVKSQKVHTQQNTAPESLRS